MHGNRTLNPRIGKAYATGFSNREKLIPIVKNIQEDTDYTNGAKIFALHYPLPDSIPHRNLWIIKTYDFLLSTVILLIFAVPTFICALIKIAADGMPLFYHSKRIGKNRTPFTVFKFRSMIKDQEIIQNYIRSHSTGRGFEKIPQDCELYTPMGRFFEKFQIVEILQVFNVFRGEMSIIGYRPLPIKHVEELEQELGKDYIAMRHSVLPGITGLSQIFGKMNLNNEERVNMENCYNIFLLTQNQFRTIFLNTLIIMETVIRIFLKRNVFMETIMSMLSDSRLAYFDIK